jgi:HSP20 family protein
MTMASEHWLPSIFGERRGELDPFRAMRRQIDELFNELSSGQRFGVPFGEGFTPRIDVTESDGELTVCAELPGVEEKDLEVTLNGNQLTIRGEKKREHEEKDEKRGVYHRVERSYGSFQRTMTLPYDVDPSRVSAEFKSGVLKVKLPKPEEAQKQSKRIDIKTS